MDGINSLIKSMPSNLPGWAYVAIVAIICLCIWGVIRSMGNNTKNIVNQNNNTTGGDIVGGNKTKSK